MLLLLVVVEIYHLRMGVKMGYELGLFLLLPALKKAKIRLIKCS